jgi:hypothetical protein
MVAGHHRKANARREQKLADEPLLSESEDFDERLDQDFIKSWREELLAQAWASLESVEKKTDSPFHTALRLRVEFPNVSSEEYAAKLSQRLGKPVRPGTARVTLHRAREKFAHCLIESVSNSLETPGRGAVEEELIELGLIKYCKGCLDSVPE